MTTPLPPPGVPKYRHVADVLRAEIRAGQLKPGDRVPSESELERRFGYDRGTVRRAVALLAREGLITVEHGRVSRVQQRQTVVRDIDESLRREYALIGTVVPEEVGLFRTLTGFQGQEEVDTTYRHVAATPDLAEAFEVPVSTGLLCRRYVYRLDGRPYQIFESYLPSELVTGTALVDPSNERKGRGTMQQLADIDVRIDRIVETFIGGRIATPEEAVTLAVPEGSPVFATRRTMRSGGKVVEIGDGVVPCSLVRFRVKVDLEHTP